MKILSPQQIALIDKKTVRRQKITSIALMERAAQICANRIMQRTSKETSVYVFCATGNNGGDGLVIARLLKESGYRVHTYVLPLKSQSLEFQHNFKKLPTESISKILAQTDLPFIEKEAIVIDAIFGNGLSRKPSGIILETIKHINNSNAYTISIDMTSGLFSQQPVTDSSSVIRANWTLTFQLPKLALLLPENKKFIKEWEILDIGLDSKSIIEAKTSSFFLIKEDIQKLYKPRKDKWAHKGSYGHALFAGGSYGKIGAAILATKALVKTGAGLVSAYIPECGYTAMQTAVPEAMAITNGQNEITSILPKVKANVIAMGPGMGVSQKTTKALAEFLKENKVALVLDADALNIISKNKELLEYLPSKTVLTPHPKELERLIGSWNDDYEKIEKVQSLSKLHDLIIVIKGAYSMIVYQDNVFFNSSGNNALATGGSGDVLTGIIAGLIAQHYEPLIATQLAVFLHGSTADIYTQKLPAETFTASDIIHYLPQSINGLKF